MATDTTRPDNRLLISVWIMFAIGLGIYFRVWDVVNEATGGMFYRTKMQQAVYNVEQTVQSVDAAQGRLAKQLHDMGKSLEKD